jgi:hypothetical protein
MSNPITVQLISLAYLQSNQTWALSLDENGNAIIIQQVEGPNERWTLVPNLTGTNAGYALINEGRQLSLYRPTPGGQVQGKDMPDPYGTPDYCWVIGDPQPFLDAQTAWVIGDSNGNVLSTELDPNVFSRAWKGGNAFQQWVIKRLD